MQDPVVVESLKVGWTEGRSQGFIPSSIFIKDESGNLAHDEEILFIQEFGFRDPTWRAIDEHLFPEATLSDLRHAKDWRGRWDRLNYVDDWGIEEKPESITTMMIEAGLDPSGPPSQPPLRLVPDWSCVITYDEYEEKIKRAAENERRVRLLNEAFEICGQCRDKVALFKVDARYFHRKEFGFVACAADMQHWQLETEAPDVLPVSASKKSAYTLLRGYLETDNRTVSSRKIIRSHTAYRKLVEMGREMVPFILGDLRDGRVGGIWTAEVLAELTGRRGGDPEWWLAWGSREQYIVAKER